MIGGDLSFTSGGWARTPVADVLPVELHDDPDGLALRIEGVRSPASEKLIDLQPFKLQLTPEGSVPPQAGAALDQGRSELERTLGELHADMQHLS